MKVKVSEETMFRFVTFGLMVAVTSATYYYLYSLQNQHCNNPFLNGLSMILSFTSMTYVLIWCISLL